MRIPDKTLLIASMAASAVGMTGLFIISLTAPAEGPESVLVGAEGTRTTIEASVVDVQIKGNVTLLTLKGGCTIDAVAFEQLPVVEGMNVTATGMIDSYKGRRQLSLDSIEQRP